MKLTWYGHSCFMLESADGSVVFDPYAPDYVPGWTLPELSADRVICSHGHSDHSYAPGVELTGREFTGRVISVDTFHDEVFGMKRGKNTVTVIETESKRIVHMGDIGHRLSRKDIKAIGTADVLMVPVGGYYTVDGRTAWDIAKSLEAKTVIPMHYRGGSFGYEVLHTVDDFIAVAGGAKFLGTNEITDGDISVPGVLIPRKV